MRRITASVIPLIFEVTDHILNLPGSTKNESDNRRAVVAGQAQKSDGGTLDRLTIALLTHTSLGFSLNYLYSFQISLLHSPGLIG